MKRMKSKQHLLYVWVIFLYHATFAQITPDNMWQFGIEPNLNSIVGETHNRNSLKSLNVFGIYKKHELYTGFDVTDIPSERHRLFGYQAGYKHHAYIAGKKSSFFIDVNYQYSKYAEGCAHPVSYNFVPDTPGVDACLAFRRVKSNQCSVGIGYELFYTKWLSTSFSSGLGQQWGIEEAPAFDVTHYMNVKKQSREPYNYLNVLVKFAIRVSFMPKDKNKSITNS